MDKITITVAGRPVAAYLCERCGAKVAPLATFQAHVARHQALGMAGSAHCVECGNAIFMLDGGRDRCQRCKAKQEGRQRRAARGRKKRSVKRMRRALEQFGDVIVMSRAGISRGR